jgi:restriction system protein
VTIPGFQDLMLPVLLAVADGQETRTGDLVSVMADRFGLSGEERERLLPSGRQTLIGNRTHWAVTYLTKTGLLERTRRGYVRIAERGRSVLSERPARVDLKYLSRFPELESFRARRSVQANGEEPVLELVERKGATPDELIRSAHAQIDAALREELIARILTSPPAFFEQLIVRLLLAMGFGGQHGATAEAIGRAGDGGLDGVIDQDALGLDRVYLQAKRYARDNAVGPNSIRDFFGSLDIAKAAKGVFITTSTFTRSARETTERLGKRIVLIDGEQLAALMIRYDVGVRIEETFHIKKVDEDFFLGSTDRLAGR